MATITSISGDTWDTIAVRAYGEDMRAQTLMQANFPLLDYEIFPSGIVLQVPEIEDTVTFSLPPWRT